MIKDSICIRSINGSYNISFKVQNGVYESMNLESLQNLEIIKIDIRTEDATPFLLANIIHAPGIGTLAENIPITLNGEENVDMYALQGDTENDLSISCYPVDLK